MPRGKYKREQQAKDDAKQTLLALSTSAGCAEKISVAVLKTLDMEKIVACPFCLYQAKLQRFLVSTKKGISQSHAQCPDCKNGMMMKSLTAKWTPEQYAEFAYPYSASGFWQKVPFKTWSKRLKEYGWAERFWNRYKELKGSDTNESYEQWLERKQYEEYSSAEQCDE